MSGLIRRLQRANKQKTPTQLARRYDCASCKKTERVVGRYNLYKTITCCGQAMTPRDQIEYVGGDPEEGQVDLIHMPPPGSQRHGLRDAIYQAEHETVTRRFEHAYDPASDDVYEVYFLRPGRRHGERIGWVHQTPLAWHWKMVPGVATSGGTALGSVECIDAMISALDEG